MKKLLLLLLANGLAALPFWAFACPICERRQPKGFAGITHGVGPGGTFDYLMLYTSLLVVALSFGLLLRFTLKADSPRNLVRRRQVSSFF